MKLQVGVKALIQNNKGQYLFLRRSKTMNDETEPHWDIPGGRIESNEALHDALVREIKEETGLTFAMKPVLVDALDIFRESADLHVVRLVYTLQGDGIPTLSDEHQETMWMSHNEALASNLDSYTRQTLLKL